MFTHGFPGKLVSKQGERGMGWKEPREMSLGAGTVPREGVPLSKFSVIVEDKFGQ